MQRGPREGAGLPGPGALFAQVVFMLPGVCPAAAPPRLISGVGRTPPLGSGSQTRSPWSLVPAPVVGGAGQGRRPVFAQLSPKEQVVCVVSYLS